MILIYQTVVAPLGNEWMLTRPPKILLPGLTHLASFNSRELGHSRRSLINIYCG